MVRGPMIILIGNHPQQTALTVWGHYLFAWVGVTPSKNFFVIYLIESPLKMMKNNFYFILKAHLVLKIFKFLSQHFGHVGKTA